MDTTPCKHIVGAVDDSELQVEWLVYGPIRLDRLENKDFTAFSFCPLCGERLAAVDPSRLQSPQRLNASFSGDASAANQRIFRESLPAELP